MGVLLSSLCVVAVYSSLCVEGCGPLPCVGICKVLFALRCVCSNVCVNLRLLCIQECVGVSPVGVNVFCSVFSSLCKLE